MCLDFSTDFPQLVHCIVEYTTIHYHKHNYYHITYMFSALSQRLNHCVGACYSVCVCAIALQSHWSSCVDPVTCLDAAAYS